MRTSSVLFVVQRWAEPRAREVRRRRRVRQRSVRYSVISGAATAGTVGLAVMSAPVWIVVATAAGAVVFVVPAAVASRTHLRLRGRPLPAARFVPHPLPPLGSAARSSAARLVRAERAMHELQRVIAESGRLPIDEVSETVEVAETEAAALHALAGHVVALERTAGVVGTADSLGATEAVRRLDIGVGEYESMVSAAVRVAEAAGAPGPGGGAGLRGAVDRLEGWADALVDIGPAHRSPLSEMGAGRAKGEP